MKRFLSFLSLIIFVTVTTGGCQAAEKSSQPAHPAGVTVTAKDLGNAFVEVAKKVGPSVVSIRSEKTMAAQMAGLRRGDVVVEVNRQTISDENDYAKALEKANPKEGVLFLIRRGSSAFYTVLWAEE